MSVLHADGGLWMSADSLKKLRLAPPAVFGRQWIALVCTGGDRAAALPL